MARKIEINNERILKSLNKKSEIIKRLNEITEEGEKLTERGKELEAEVNTLLAKIQREDELVRPEIFRELDNLGVTYDEFEEFSKCELIEDGDDAGKAFITIADRLEEFKEFYKQKKNEELIKNNSSDTTSPDGDSEPNSELSS
jgi:predicted transcriptional regulator